MGARMADWIALAFLVSVVYVLVRPRSQAAQFVDAFAQFITSLVRAATGLASP